MKYTSLMLIAFLVLITSCKDKNKFEQMENDEPIFVTVSKDDPEMNQAFCDAKASLDQFNALLVSPEHTNSFKLLKIKILDERFSAETGEDEYAYLWVNNVQRDGEDYLGYIFELPAVGINDLKPNTWISFDEGYVYDWMIQNQEGQTWGGFTIRVLREKEPPNQRASFDEYQGITEYK